jgi:superfamily II DNA/RNA helicase
MTTPTAVQAAVLPKLLPHTGPQDKAFPRLSLIVAPTGSGKTAAFTLPLLQAAYQHPYATQAIILTPTRELATQVYEHAVGLGARLLASGGIVIHLAVGGTHAASEGSQVARRPPHIVIGTPGRVAALLPDLRVKRLRFLVMDEADQLLRGAYSQGLRAIMAAVPAAPARHTILVSATESPSLVRVCELRAPDLLHRDSTPVAEDRLDHRFWQVRGKHRSAYVVALAQALPASQQALVFVERRSEVPILGGVLRAQGVKTALLYADLEQKERDTGLAAFRTGRARVLVATDVAARGLDVPTVSVVLSTRIAQDQHLYTHRAGRTGRTSGVPGMSITLVSSTDLPALRVLERQMGFRFKSVAADPQPDFLAQATRGKNAAVKKVLRKVEMASAMVKNDLEE